jgi:hypothetical protein
MKPLRIPLDQARAGMQIARAVKDDRDRLLCAEGTALSEALLGRLRAMKVTSLWVDAEGWALGDDGPPPEEQLALLAHRFRRVMDDPVMAGLHRILAARITGA